MTKREDEVQLFNKGEKVLCYEPDKSNARVLYDSKVTHAHNPHTHTYIHSRIHQQRFETSNTQMREREVIASIFHTEKIVYFVGFSCVRTQGRR